MIALGVLIQLTALVFGLWYADAFDFIFCDSSFFGSPACPDGRPGRRLVLYGVPLLGILIGGAVPPRLLGANWTKTALLFVVIPLITTVVILTPVALLIALIRAQS